MRSAGGTLVTETRLVPRSGASGVGPDDSSNTSNCPGEPARAANVVTTESTKRAGEGVVVPVLAASNTRWASDNPAAASPTEARSFASSKPLVTRESKENPSAAITKIDSTNVVVVTRSSSELRQMRLTHRGPASRKSMHPVRYLFILIGR